MDPSIFDHSQYLNSAIPGPGVATVWKLDSLPELTKLFELLYFPNMQKPNMSLLWNVDFILIKRPVPAFISVSDEIKLLSRFNIVAISEKDWSKLPQEGTTIFLSRKIGQPKFKCHFQECIKDRSQGTY